MTVGRRGLQITRKPHQRSHVSGKHQARFASQLQENLDSQCERLERELCSRPSRLDDETASDLVVEDP